MMTALMLQALAQTVPQSATDQLLSQGLSGVVILGLLGALLFLQRRIDKLHEQIDALNASRLGDRDLRLGDGKENGKVLLEVNDRYKETILENTRQLQELREEIQALRPRPYR
ncbi:MAG: hypothetical protein EPO32_14875 [Anaerolineae bacterium]|nr:MAG: hypothetical protein EPO32_14875 [Anaerolineae bacterium]